MNDHNTGGFELHITDFDKFIKFVEVIRNTDDEKIKELTNTLEKSDDALLKAEKAQTP